MKIISLFSGAGGLDLGFIKAGHTIVWANDIDSDCVKSYTANIGDHIVEGDIQKMSLSDVPDADLVIGGFPCQGFSCANLKRTEGDERNALYLQFLRVLKTKKTPYFLAENVRGILSLGGGKVMEMILGDFQSLGYRVKYRVLNAADYGIPQNRRRVIIIGTRKNLPQEIEPDFPKETHSELGEGNLKKWVTIGQALKNIPDPDSSKQTLFNHECSKYKVTNRNFTGHRTTDPDKPSPTILARGNGKGGVCAIQHPKNHRRLSVRESAIVQTFPNNFRFFGSLNSMYRQVGNAVPVLLAEKIAKQFTKVESGMLVTA